MKNPEIRIKDAWLLRENASAYLNELLGEGLPLRSDEEYRKIVDDYRTAWQPFEQTILDGMQTLLDLRFRQQIIDVYIAPWFSAFSDPMVIGVVNLPDVFIDVLSHELLHRLLMDNTTVPYDKFLPPEWQKLFGKHHSDVTLIHIPVHAALKSIYLDTLQAPERLARDIQRSKDNGATDYAAAWEYVEQQGYNEIVYKLKESYKTLGKAK
jgi:hypothetical protein